MYDVAIIGAGPSGATLARLIGRTHKVLLVDKRESVDSNCIPVSGKCCGGLLAPDAQRMLSTLGLGLPSHVLEEPQLFLVKTVDIEQGLERYYQRHYINLNRQKFDRWLLSMVPTSVDLRMNCRFEAYSSGDGFDLTLIQGSKAYTEQTRVLVGADGACSRLRSLSFPRVPFPRRYFAIQEWMEQDHSPPYFTALFDRKITDFYAWIIPKGTHLVFGAAMRPGKEASQKFALLKEKLRDRGFRLGKVLRREGAFVLRPLRGNQLLSGERGIALLGEAAGWISPSSGEGLSYAFRSAVMLAEALHEMPNEFAERYREKTRALRRNILLKNLKSHFIFHPALRKVILYSGLRSIEVQED